MKKSQVLSILTKKEEIYYEDSRKKVELLEGYGKS